MAPTPPAAPANINSRRSVGGSLSNRASHEPNPAPIWAIGPSWPAEPPVPMVMIDAIALMIGHPGPDHSATSVESSDHGVRPMPLSLGRPGEDQRRPRSGRPRPEPG